MTINVGRLKELIKDLPDETPMHIIYDIDHSEYKPLRFLEKTELIKVRYSYGTIEYFSYLPNDFRDWLMEEGHSLSYFDALVTGEV